jgi:hypothetical protein
MRQQSAERRNHYRIKDEIVLQYRRIQESDCERLIQRIDGSLPNAFSIKARFAALDQRMVPTLKQIEAAAPAVARYLCLLDQKLDLLAEYMTSQEMETLNPDPVEVDISAGGIAFGTDIPMDRGTLLELRLLLLPSLVGIQAYGRVVYCRPAEGGAAAYRVGVRYECIQEEDRDLIARHVLHRDAERLRKCGCAPGE